MKIRLRGFLSVTEAQIKRKINSTNIRLWGLLLRDKYLKKKGKKKKKNHYQGHRFQVSGRNSIYTSQYTPQTLTVFQHNWPFILWPKLSLASLLSTDTQVCAVSIVSFHHTHKHGTRESEQAHAQVWRSFCSSIPPPPPKLTLKNRFSRHIIKRSKWYDLQSKSGTEICFG